MIPGRIQNSLKLYYAAIKQTSKCGRLIFTLRTCSTISVQDEYKDSNELDELDKRRNKSRMTEYLRKRMNREPSNPDVVLECQPSYVNKRHHRFILKRVYGSCGEASGIDARILWPTREELQDKINYEKEFYPTLQEMLMKLNAKKKEEAEAYKKREEEVLKNYEKLEGWFKDLEDRKAKKLAAIEAQKQKKERLIEEVRSHFGYRVDPSDSQFQELLEKKEKEEKKAFKEARRKEKLEKKLGRVGN